MDARHSRRFTYEETFANARLLAEVDANLFGTGFIKISIDENHNLRAERIDPREVRVAGQVLAEVA